MRKDNMNIYQEKRKKLSQTLKKSDYMIFPKGTKEAVKYGEKAKPEDMVQLVERFMDCFTNLNFLSAFNAQLIGEAMHAYKKDEWYQTYLRDIKPLL